MASDGKWCNGSPYLLLSKLNRQSMSLVGKLFKCLSSLLFFFFGYIVEVSMYILGFLKKNYFKNYFWVFLGTIGALQWTRIYPYPIDK